MGNRVTGRYTGTGLPGAATPPVGHSVIAPRTRIACWQPLPPGTAAYHWSPPGPGCQRQARPPLPAAWDFAGGSPAIVSGCRLPGHNAIAARIAGVAASVRRAAFTAFGFHWHTSTRSTHNNCFRKPPQRQTLHRAPDAPPPSRRVAPGLPPPVQQPRAPVCSSRVYNCFARVTQA